MMAQLPVGGTGTTLGALTRFDTKTNSEELYLDQSASQVSFTLPANATVLDAHMKVEGTLPPVVQRYPVAPAPVAIKGADLDKDGNLDLAVLSERNDSVIVFFNDGQGHFDKTQAQEFMVAHDPQDMALGDLDMDGKTDLVAVNESNGAVTVRLSKTALFGSMTNYLVGGKPIKVLVGDMNNDTYPDIVVVRKEFPCVAILYNKGDGTFNPPTDVSVNAAPQGAALVDVNRDGKLDILVASSARPYSVNYVRNLGSKNFEEADKFPLEGPPSDLVTADLNGDGRTDLIAPSVQGNISVLMAVGNTFPSMTVLRCTKQQAAFAGDLNNDGHTDLVTVSGEDSTVRTFINKGNGSLSPDQLFMTGSDPSAVFLGDLNGDGSLDVATADKGGNSVSVSMNFGTGRFAWYDIYDIGQSDKMVALGDLNGDGQKDLVSTNTAGQSVTVAYNAGKGQFTTKRVWPGYKVNGGGAGPLYPTIADYNGDGQNDIEYGEELSGAAIMMFNGGNQNFSSDSVAHQGGKDLLPAPAFMTVAADVNGDKVLDLVIDHLDHDYLSVLINDGTGHFDERINHSMDGKHPYGLVAEDFNNDGVMDFVTADYGMGQKYESNLTFIQSDGKGNLTNVLNLPVHPGPISLAFADMNHDGLRDIVVAFAPKKGPADNTPGEVAVILADKNPLQYKSPMYFQAGVLPGLAHPADLNDDGVPDLLCLNQGTTDPGTLSLLMNNGDGSLRAPITYPDIPFKLAAFGDLNGDERDEMVEPVFGSDVAVYRALYYPANIHINGPAGDNLLQGPGLFQGVQDLNLTSSVQTWIANNNKAPGNMTYTMNLSASRSGMVHVFGLEVSYKVEHIITTAEPKKFSPEGTVITVVLLVLLAFVAGSVTSGQQRKKPEPVRPKTIKPKGTTKSKEKRMEPGPVIIRKPAVQVKAEKEDWDKHKDAELPAKAEATKVPKGPAVKVEVSKDWKPSKQTIEKMKLEKATELRDDIKVERKYKKGK